MQAAARPGARLAQLADVFEGTLREDGWELGAPTQHFDFHGQGMDVIEYPWFAAEQPWGGSRDLPLEPGAVLSYHQRERPVGTGVVAGRERQPPHFRDRRGVVERRLEP